MPDLGEIRVKVHAEGVEEASEQMREIQQDPQGLFTGLTDGMPDMDGAGMDQMANPLEGMLSSIMGMSKMMMGILGAVLGVVMILASMEPVQKMMKAFMSVIQAFFLPLAMLLIKLLAPIMRFMLKLLPFWLQFWDDPIGSLKEIGKFLWELMKQLPGLIWSLVQKIPDLVWKLVKMLPKLLWAYYVKLPMMIWDYMKQLPRLIGSAIRAAIPGFQHGGVVRHTGVAQVHRGEGIIPAREFRQLMRNMRNIGGNGASITIEGGLDTFIERYETDPNVRR